jgi:MerR family redox-sensitive transcriptional activator SoxR
LTPKDDLSIGDFAARAGVPASALRFYENRGLIRSRRTSGNQRRYARAELRRVAFIRTAQQIGLSLEEIADALAELPESRTPNRSDWARLSEHWKDRLNWQIDMLVKVRDKLTDCIGCGCLSLSSCRLVNRDDHIASHGPGPRRLIEG